MHNSPETYKRMELYIHILIWVCVFTSPILFFWRENEAIDSFDVLHRLYYPVASCLLFYLNYCLLIPHLLMPKHYRWFVCINLIAMFGFTLFHELYLIKCVTHFPEFPMEPHPHRPPPQEKEWITHGLNMDFLHSRKPLFFVRDFLTLLLIGMLSVAVKLSWRWREAEMARKKAELARTEAELINLKNQTNPHFLLNTLNNIYALIGIDTDKAQKSLLQLSVLLRYVLYEDHAQPVPLTKEVDFIDTYVELMRLRFNEKVEIRKSLQVKEPEKICIASLIFISLVENAFKHGISSCEKCFISFSLTGNPERLVFTCENSNHPKTKSDKAPRGIGLQLIEGRLRHYYPDSYTWQYGPREDGKTYRSVITIRLHPSTTHT